MRALGTSLAVLLVAASSLACDGGTNPPGGLQWTAASTDPNVLNLTQTTFAEGSTVTDAVRAECGLERRIPEQIARNSPIPVALAVTPDGPTTLHTTVTYILGHGGGGFSGPKSITIHGELVQGGAVVASFDARRTTMRGGGTCDQLRVVADAIGKDVRPWLAAPTLNAKLGEAE